MKRLMSVAVMVLVAVMATPVHAQQSPEHYGAVIHQLSVMFKTAPPSSVEVNVVSQKEITKLFNDLLYQGAIRGCSNGVDGMMCRLQVRRQIDDSPQYVKGLWIREDDPTALHIVLYRGEDNIEVLCHEWLHWYLHNSTEPKGMVNHHSIVYPMVSAVLLNPAFLKWLEEQER